MADTNAMSTVLVADDTSENLAVIHGVLRGRYRVKVATDGEHALEVAARCAPDLILLDVMMPGIDGYEVCRRLKAAPETAEIPVIFLTARAQIGDEQLGFDLGAVDYITKPVSPPILLARVRAQLQLKESRDLLRDNNRWLEREVERRTSELERIKDLTIVAMASLGETRDNETGHHILRTQHYVRALAERLQRVPRFARELDANAIDLLHKSAPLHDIGKIGIPDRILQKAGRLEADEFEVMKRHTTLGFEAIARAERYVEADLGFLRYAREIALSHHERWDGTGYPHRLAGEDIPVSARLMAIADVYDALISRRVYKPAYDHAEAVRLIHQGRGSQFDPEMVEAFLATAPEFETIAAEYRDRPAPVTH